VRKLLVAGLLAAAAAVAVVVVARGAGSGPAEAVAGGVEVVRVTRRDIGSTVKATGVIEPRVGAEVRVGSRLSGVVTRLHVRVGDLVERGQLLAEIDDRELRARRREAEAALALARANVGFTQADLRRKRELSAAGVLAPSELDLAERANRVAEQQEAQAAAALDSAATQLGYARITAPIAGIVASVSTQEGETVAASFAAPTFVTLLDLSRLEVWAYVDETDIGRVEPGQAATFTVDTYDEERFAGTVVAIHPQAEIRDNVVNYVTVVRFTPPAGRVLRPEMTATVRIELPARRGAPALPLRAVRREGGRPYVLVPGEREGERHWVTPGVRDETHVEMAAGLREGDAVLAAGADERRREEPR
jgi:macrolide-specific efflux system membrane fusion protein